MRVLHLSVEGGWSSYHGEWKNGNGTSSAIVENGRMGMGPHLWFEVESDIGMDHRVSDLLLLRPHQNKRLPHATSRPMNLDRDTECTYNCILDATQKNS